MNKILIFVLIAVVALIYLFPTLIKYSENHGVIIDNDDDNDDVDVVQPVACETSSGRDVQAGSICEACPDGYLWYDGIVSDFRPDYYNCDSMADSIEESVNYRLDRSFCFTHHDCKIIGPSTAPSDFDCKVYWYMCVSTEGEI